MVLKGNAQALDAETVLRSVSSTEEGLTSSEAKRRLSEFGPNVLQEEKTSHLLLFLRQFNNVLIFFLIFACVISLALGKVGDFAIIASLVLINGIIGFWQELKAEASLKALKRLTESVDIVLRDGQRTDVKSSELVPGDIVVLSEGVVVTADVRLLHSESLSVDESLLTGESIDVEKDATAMVAEDAQPYELENCVVSGTTVRRGTGLGVVVATGNDTYLASIARKAEEKAPSSPLTKALAFFSRRYVAIVVLIVAALSVIGLLQGRDFAEVAYLMVAQLVSAVPEGLPLVVTVVMVVGALSLSKKKTLVRYLPSVETLGSATIIASDKTGTITEGRLSVTDTFFVDEAGSKLCAALCNDSKDGKGDGIDVAMATFLEDDFERLKSENARIWVHPFDTNLRAMATLNDVNGERTLFVKGAFEALRGLSDDDGSGMFEPEIDRMTSKGLRVIALGMGGDAVDDPSAWKVRIIGLMGFVDPPKKGVAEAVESARKAGVRVMMVTGDHPGTARAIAESVSIFREGDDVITGKEIDALGDHDLCGRLRRTTVLARATPENKYRVVKLLQANDEIVAVTGDGVNDVPAIRAADLGIAMGSGTEAAKSASKMVIVDNDLGIIVEAIRLGRNIADNLRKVIYYLLSTNIMELMLVGAALIAGLPSPLTAVQILWVNLVTDGVPDKVFPFIKAEGDVMERGPRKPTQQFFDGSQIKNTLYFSLVMGSALFVMYIWLRGMFDDAIVNTIMFTSVSFVQFVNAIEAQKEREPFLKNIRWSIGINKYVYAAIGVAIGLQLLAVYPLGDLLSATALSLEHWEYVGAICLFTFVVLELRKFTELFLAKRRPEEPKREVLTVCKADDAT
ncbi:MAG: cation-transporting P-type ATPase [Euryarchaeota archaeon]|nr:cation-transporting P-type ATPase [Euryarchaeota archaeon]